MNGGRQRGVQVGEVIRFDARQPTSWAKMGASCHPIRPSLLTAGSPAFLTALHSVREEHMPQNCATSSSADAWGGRVL